jgi:hypothetical protein
MSTGGGRKPASTDTPLGPTSRGGIRTQQIEIPGGVNLPCGAQAFEPPGAAHALEPEGFMYLFDQSARHLPLSTA